MKQCKINYPEFGRFRTSIYYRNSLPEFAIRMCNNHVATREDLGLPKPVEELVDRPSGLILITGPTGSGKTECSIIPIFTHLKNSQKKGFIKALYITPLRALNRDVFRRIIRYAENDNLTIEIRHGDTSQKIRRKIL